MLCYVSGLCKCDAVISGVRVVCIKCGLCMLYVCLGVLLKAFVVFVFYVALRLFL